MVNDIFDRQQFRDIIARFIRQLQACIIHGQPQSAVFLLCALNRTFSPVIGRQRQFPVTEHLMQFFQVIQCACGRPDDVASAVIPPVLPQPEIATGGRHELPDAGGIAGRARARIETALYHGQQRNFAGHAAAFHFAGNVIKVAARPVHHAHNVVGATGIPLLVFGDQRAVYILQREATAQTLPETALVQFIVRNDTKLNVMRIGEGGRRVG